MKMVIRGQMSKAFLQKWPMALQNKQEARNVPHGSIYNTLFIHFRIAKMSKYCRLVNLKCESIDVTVNRKIFHEISGGRIAIGYLKSGNGWSSGLMFVMSRAFFAQKRHYDGIILDGIIDKIVVVL